jgi:hypothetical protein
MRACENWAINLVITYFVLKYVIVAHEILAQLHEIAGISWARAGLWPAAAHPCAA